MNLKIREAEKRDFDRIEEILEATNMLNYPETDGREAMKRIVERMGRYFLVAEVEEKVVGMIRGSTDGSRPIIYQLSVDPQFHGRGTGKKLMAELAKRFKEDGTKTVSVTARYYTIGYYEKLGFKKLDLHFMLTEDIDRIIEKENKPKK